VSRLSWLIQLTVKLLGLIWEK